MNADPYIWVLIVESDKGRGIVHYCSTEEPSVERLNEMQMFGGTITDMEVLSCFPATSR